MKRIYITSLLLLAFFTNSYAQKHFQKAYFIDRNNTKTECLIDNKNWKENPESFDFKLNSKSDKQKISLAEVKEFYIYDTDQYYQSHQLKTDLYEFNGKKIKSAGDYIFLKVLLESEKSLFLYAQKVSYFFFNDETGVHLMEYSEKKTNQKNIESRAYQKQLYESLECDDFDVNTFSLLKYKEVSLVNLFTSYYHCKDLEFDNYYKEKTVGILDFKFNLGLNYNPSLTTKATVFTGLFEAGSLTTVDESKFESSSLTFGFEIEYYLSNNLDKWRLFFAANYQTFEGNNSSVRDPLLISDGASFSLTNIEFPIGVRRYFKLNENFDFYLSTAFAYNLTLSENYDSNLPEGTNVGVDNTHFELNQFSLMLGAGSTFKRRLSVSLNYYIYNRHVIEDFVEVDASGTLNVLLSYKLF